MKINKFNSVVSVLLGSAIFLSACQFLGAKKILTEQDILAADGTFLYKITYEEGLENAEAVFDEINNLFNQISASFDIKVNLQSDKKNESDGKVNEILVGNTNRDESEIALRQLLENRENNLNDYLIKVIDNKICIVGGSDDALSRGIRYFTETYCLNFSTLSKLDSDFEYSHFPEYSIDKVEIFGSSIGEYVIVVPVSHSLLWTELLDTFVSKLQNDFGLAPQIVKDSEIEADKEIIIGSTNRNESADIPEEGFVIKQVGNDIIINGSDDVQIAEAILTLNRLEEAAVKESKSFEIMAPITGKAEKNDTDYYLAYSDEFNESTLDTSIWVDYKRTSGTSTSLYGGTCYRTGLQNTRIENGNLVLTSERLNHDDFTWCQIATEGTLAARYGIIEWRVKFPESPVTTALWCNWVDYELTDSGKVSRKYPTRLEIDVVESFGRNKSFATNLHNWFDDEDLNYSYVEGHKSLDGGKFAKDKAFEYQGNDKLSDDYHIYSCKWTPYEISFAFDGDIFFTYDLIANNGIDYTSVPQMFLIGVTYGTSKNYGKVDITDDSPLKGSLYCDWFRIYQTDSYDSLLWQTPVGSKFY